MVHYPARRGELDAGNPLLGTVIDGKYRLQSVLGRGGLGTVFRAQHVGSLVTVALKLLHPRYSERAEYRRALLPEARRAATVVHERCARLLDVGEGDEGITYLAMELVEGQTLDEVMQQGALSPSHTVDLLIQITAALNAVHEVGLVHCDLSPRNVMVSSRSGRLEAKVLDFGIARSMNIAGRENQQGELWGFANPAFSAPELLAGVDVDARADLYSLGTLAWLMLTGTMPVDDSDAERAVAAVREGDLNSWQRVPGVPARLVRLVLRCLSFGPEDRPASAAEVYRQLVSVRTGRGPGLLRLATLTSALALVLTLAASESAPDPFLRSKAGSLLDLSAPALAANSPVSHLRERDLAKVNCDYGGFAPTRLRADIARDGEVLAPVPLSPQVDRQASTFTLSTAQQSWQEVVQGLLRASKDGPVDLSLTVPGTSLVRAVRVRVDAEPPTVAARFANNGTVLHRRTQLLLDLADDIGVGHVEAEITVAGQDAVVLPLPTVTGAFELGEQLAAQVSGVRRLGGGTLVVRAADLAGNMRILPAIPVTAVDLGVPHVTQVRGPGGQMGLTLDGDKVRFRVRLSDYETDCSLRCHAGDVADAVVVPLPATSVGALTHIVEVPLAKLGGRVGNAVISLAVIDAAGNLDEREFTTTVVDRSPRVEIKGLTTAGDLPVEWRGSELLLSPDGGRFEVSVSEPYGVKAIRVRRANRSFDDGFATFENTGAGRYDVRVEALPPGEYELRVDLLESGQEQLVPQTRIVPARVLPHQVEVRVPRSQSRFLPQLVDEGLLQFRNDATGQLGEGRGWRLDPGLRRYLAGNMWLNGVPRDIQSDPGALLPDFEPAPGRNTVAIQLTDVLGRAVRVTGDDGQVLAPVAGRIQVAEFWWSDGAARMIGAPMLVEHDQAVRIRIRLPLPFAIEDTLRLGYPNGERIASQVVLENSVSVASFDLTFNEWSAAAKLGGRSREEFADGLTGTIKASVTTPAGNFEKVDLQLQTTRSTLSPMRLGDFVEVPDELKSLQLLPVLAPTGPFTEPVPAEPPRFSFRPQWGVNVRNMADIMLQDREFEWGQARALMTHATTIVDDKVRLRCVHHFDPLGIERLQPQNLLPPQPAGAAPPNDAVLTGVDFFQAWTFSRLLGVVVAKDPSLFRLPLGCELERAAFGDVRGDACHGVRAHGGSVQMSAFVATTMPVVPWTSAQTRSFGDVISTSYGLDFVGLDFGVREWVLDLPHMPRAEDLLAEWTGDHKEHLERIMAVASGEPDMQPPTLSLQRQLAVVRGLAFGEAYGLLDAKGHPLAVARHQVLPNSVPGVLRTAQLNRNGRDLLSGAREPRLKNVGFRLAGDAKELARKWGYR